MASAFRPLVDFREAGTLSRGAMACCAGHEHHAISAQDLDAAAGDPTLEDCCRCASFSAFLVLLKRKRHTY